MTQHMNPERISALLDEPAADRECQAHLEQCGDCRAEFERLSRMRMALSGLPDEQAPHGGWERLQVALAESGRGTVAESGGPAGGVLPSADSLGRRLTRGLLVWGPLQAAAALVLFAGGVTAGLWLTGTQPSGPASADTEGMADPASLPTVVTPADQRTMLDGLNRVESLRPSLRQVGDGMTGGSQPGVAAGVPPAQVLDPIEAAELLARIDGAIRALRETLDENPDDLFANASLLELVERRDRLAEQLGRATGTRTW